jgi:Rod binding domain-containing protein
MIGGTPGPSLTQLTLASRAVPESATKAGKAARDFEAVLLGSLLEAMQSGFSQVPGEESGAGSDDYLHLGTQVLAAALASSGGIGIARTIMNNLPVAEISGPAPTGLRTTKSVNP